MMICELLLVLCLARPSFSEPGFIPIEEVQPRMLMMEGVNASSQYLDYKPSNAIDGDYAKGGFCSGVFCTEEDGERWLIAKLRKTYRVTEIRVWGTDGTLESILKQAMNLTISVSLTVDLLQDSTSLCSSRDGLPTAGQNRPEVFSCNRTMIGNYVKLEMVDILSAQHFCIAELQVYGTDALPGDLTTTPKTTTTSTTIPTTTLRTTTISLPIRKLPIIGVNVSSHYHTYVPANVIDGDYGNGSSSEIFCTEQRGERWLLVRLRENYEVAEVRVWGKDKSDNFTLKQSMNLRISVAPTVALLQNPRYLCSSRNGLPTPGQNRPEMFGCGHMMTGKYVKVEMMVHVRSPQHLCLAEVEVFGKVLHPGDVTTTTTTTTTTSTTTIHTDTPTATPTSTPTTTARTARKLEIKGVSASNHYHTYVPANVIDGDYGRGSYSSSVFCTQQSSERWLIGRLDRNYQVKEVRVWGKDANSDYFLMQSRDLRISVAPTLDQLQNSESFCASRDGLPTPGQNRPEMFACNHTMTGKYVKVEMVGNQSAQHFCLAEVEVFGNGVIPGDVTTAPTPTTAPTTSRRLTIQGVTASNHYQTFVPANVIDGDYGIGSSSSSVFCTQQSGERWLLARLRRNYRVTEVRVWGKDETTIDILNQSKNLRISVAPSVNLLQKSRYLCASRNGLPTAGQNRPEVFTCGRTMTGKYVKVEMVNTQSDQRFCVVEVEVFGRAQRS